MSLQTKPKSNAKPHNNNKNSKQTKKKVKRCLHAGSAPIMDMSPQIPKQDHCSQHLEKLLTADNLVHS